MDEFDFIIVGGGSAGSVLAERLTICGRHRVLLLEAGGTDRLPWVKVPIGYGKSFYDRRVNWCFSSEPEQGLNGRTVYWPRGKVLGGSSSINGLVWMRGLAGDFDDWASEGNAGWAWQDIAPTFDQIEALDQKNAEQSGRVSVAARSNEYHPIGHAYLSAARAAGLPDAPHDNSHWSEGVAPYRITTLRGLRHSAADAFVRPAMRRKNLIVRTGVMVDRVLFEDRRAKTVRYARAGRGEIATASRAVVLAAGAVGSPAILQRSGIGPGPLLTELGVQPIYENSMVGGGLQDHLGIDYLFRATQPTLNQVLGTWRGQIGAALRFALSRSGPLSLSVNQMGGLVRSSHGLNRADLQLYFNPLSYTTQRRNRRVLLRPDPWPGFAFGFNACRPTSRGRVDIQSKDPGVAPRIAPNYVSTKDDVASAIAGARLIARVLETPELRDLVAEPNGFTPQGMSDREILEDFRARASSVFHACGTCRMAPQAKDGVVDSTLKVHGVDGLRVVDASVFPNITSANTNAPTIMVAARAAEMILKE
ncbi:MAG: GMC family oxidoreductase N-terminal domain-containing protein [Pseudomonadota bacterium]